MLHKVTDFIHTKRVDVLIKHVDFYSSIDTHAAATPVNVRLRMQRCVQLTSKPAKAKMNQLKL